MALNACVEATECSTSSLVMHVLVCEVGSAPVPLTGSAGSPLISIWAQAPTQGSHHLNLSVQWSLSESCLPGLKLPLLRTSRKATGGHLDS